MWMRMHTYTHTAIDLFGAWRLVTSWLAPAATDSAPLLPNAGCCECWWSNNWLNFIAFQRIHWWRRTQIIEMRLHVTMLSSFAIFKWFYYRLNVPQNGYSNGLVNDLKWRLIGRFNSLRKKSKTKHKKIKVLNETEKAIRWPEWVSEQSVCCVVIMANGWLVYTML